MPAPFGPKRATISLGLSVTSTLLTTVRPPYFLTKPVAVNCFSGVVFCKDFFADIELEGSHPYSMLEVESERHISLWC